jgi:hypothetical protein
MAGHPGDFSRFIHPAVTLPHPTPPYRKRALLRVAASVFWGPHLLDVAVIKQTPVALVQREKEKSEYETELLKLQRNINIGPR